MKQIASFTIDHDLLEKGMYVSRIDGDVITYDIRMKKRLCRPHGLPDRILFSSARHRFQTGGFGAGAGELPLYCGL